jgi:hypothetical protein
MEYRVTNGPNFHNFPQGLDGGLHLEGGAAAAGAEAGQGTSAWFSNSNKFLHFFFFWFYYVIKNIYINLPRLIR